MKRIALWFLAMPLGAAPIFVNTGSATLSCLGPGNVESQVQATGPDISLNCPPGTAGGSISGSSAGLSVEGQISSGGPLMQGTNHLDLTTSLQDTVTETGGIGPGTEEFRLAFNWQGVGDPGSPMEMADLLYNGMVVWSEQKAQHNREDPLPHTETILIDEPFSFGQPFTFQAEVGLSDTESGIFASSQASASLAVVHQAIPEPRTIALVGWVLALALLWKRISVIGADERT